MNDGMIDRILTVIDNKQCDFETSFSQQSRINLTENHLWLSLVLRPQKNAFTRVQRLSVILMALFLTMISNAMFFKSSANDAVTPDTVQIGGIRLSLKTIYVSFIGCIITVPPAVLVTFIFRNVSSKTKQKNRTRTGTIKDNDEMIITVTEKKTFPHYAIYFAWGILVLGVVTSGFFLLLFSMQWGKDKAEEWLTTFIVSFVESFMIVDPLKVCLVRIAKCYDNFLNSFVLT